MCSLTEVVLPQVFQRKIAVAAAEEVHITTQQGRAVLRPRTRSGFLRGTAERRPHLERRKDLTSVLLLPSRQSKERGYTAGKEEKKHLRRSSVPEAVAADSGDIFDAALPRVRIMESV